MMLYCFHSIFIYHDLSPHSPFKSHLHEICKIHLKRSSILCKATQMASFIIETTPFTTYKPNEYGLYLPPPAPKYESLFPIYDSPFSILCSLFPTPHMHSLLLCSYCLSASLPIISCPISPNIRYFSCSLFITPYLLPSDHPFPHSLFPIPSPLFFFPSSFYSISCGLICSPLTTLPLLFYTPSFFSISSLFAWSCSFLFLHPLCFFVFLHFLSVYFFSMFPSILSHSISLFPFTS